jgi:hypothetical protein
VKKVAIDHNKVSKFCNVAIMLAYSIFPDRKYCTCDFGPDFTKLPSKFHPLNFPKSPEPNEPVTDRYSVQNIEQQCEGIVGSVLRECVAGVGDDDATTAGLSNVDVVD